MLRFLKTYTWTKLEEYLFLILISLVDNEHCDL